MNKKIMTHPALNYADDLKQICLPLQLLSIAYFAHVQIDQQGMFSALALQPEFVKLYLDKEYYRYDIHMAQTKDNESYVIWDNISRVKESKQLHDDFMSFNIGHTFTICQNNAGLKEYFHFAVKLGESFMNQQYLIQLDYLKKFILYFREKINLHRELKQAYQVKFSIPKNESGYFTNSKFNVIQLDHFNELVATNRTFVNHAAYLTQKEMQCLHYMAQGLKNKEIAKLLSITPRTIKAHIRNIKSKLDCQNQFQLGFEYARITK